MRVFILRDYTVDASTNKVGKLFSPPDLASMNFRKLAAPIFLFLLLAFSAQAQTELVRARLVRVHDGDTITVRDASKRNFKIRLIGVDAPELKQKFGEKARRELKRILRCDAENIVVKTFGLDRYNRILAQVFINQTDIELELLQNGFVWFYDSSELPKSDWKLYRAAFEKARETKADLFANEKAVNPKDFRRRKRGR